MGLNAQPTPLKSIKEVLRLKPETELQNILDRQVTPENIEIFFQRQLDDVVTFVGKLAAKYVSDHPEIQFPAPGSNAWGAVEDIALLEANVERDIPAVLEAISAHIARVTLIQAQVAGLIASAEEVEGGILPPSQRNAVTVTEQLHADETKESVNRGRVTSLLFVLTEGGITQQEYKVTVGKREGVARRNERYYSVVVPGIQRVILVCDEDENATYIFDSAKMRDLDLETSNLMRNSKERLTMLIRENPGLGKSLMYSPLWNQHLEPLLFKPLPLIEHSPPVQSEPIAAMQEETRWNGFAVGPDGHHYGTLARLFELEPRLPENLVDYLSGLSSGISWCWLRTTNGQLHPAYAYEQVVTKLETFMTTPHVENDGEWRGFLLVEHAGQAHHIGPVGSITEKLKKFGSAVSYDIVSRMCDAAVRRKITAQNVRTTNGRFLPGFSFEDVKREVDAFLAIPLASKSEPYAGFVSISDQEHYAPLLLLHPHLKLTKDQVFNLSRKFGDAVKKLTIRDLSNKATVAYCLEDIKAFIEAR